MDCRRDAQIYAPRQKVSADFPSILKSEYRLFYKGSFAKETYNFKEPTECSHPIVARLLCIWMSHAVYQYVISYINVSCHL